MLKVWQGMGLPLVCAWQQHAAILLRFKKGGPENPANNGCKLIITGGSDNKIGMA